MKNKKGFTLIELLAVIVILAIILVIAVPQVMKVVNQSKSDSLASSAKMILKALETEYMTRELSGATQLTSSTLFAQTCPTTIAKWDTTNGICTYNLTVASGDITVLEVKLTPGATGKFIGVAAYTATR